jgi:hypothetical protein
MSAAIRESTEAALVVESVKKLTRGIRPIIETGGGWLSGAHRAFVSNRKPGYTLGLFRKSVWKRIEKIPSQGSFHL